MTQDAGPPTPTLTSGHHHYGFCSPESQYMRWGWWQECDFLTPAPPAHIIVFWYQTDVTHRVWHQELTGYHRYQQIFAYLTWILRQRNTSSISLNLLFINRKVSKCESFKFFWSVLCWQWGEMSLCCGGWWLSLPTGEPGQARTSGAPLSWAGGVLPCGPVNQTQAIHNILQAQYCQQISVGTSKIFATIKI